jgi:LacI family transcriptional regulator
MTKQLRRATIKDVAGLAGVSTTTVSFVLNNTGSIGTEVRERVLRAIKDTHYRPNRQAAAIRTGASRTIGLVLPDLTNPFFPELAEAISEAAMAANYTVLLGGGRGGARERESLDRLAAQGVDGICWCPSSNIDTPQELNLTQPIVVIDRPLPRYDTVISDFALGGRLLEAAVQRGGYKRIGMVLGPHDLPGSEERWQSFVQAVGGEARIMWEVENSYGLELSDEVRDRIGKSNVECIICANDMIAIAVIRHARSVGIDVPNKLAVIGFDDIPWAALVEPPLTTVRQRVRDMGAAAITLLLQRIADAERPIKHVKVDVELIYRGTTIK